MTTSASSPTFDAQETLPPPHSSSNDDNATASGDDNIVEQAASVFLLSEALRPGAPGSHPPAAPLDSAVPFTTYRTYHLLLVKSHYSALLCLLMLGDFTALLCAFVRAATVVVVSRAIRSFYPHAQWPKWSS